MVAFQPSFYAPVPDPDRVDDLMRAYLDHLAERNGELDGDARFGLREGRMAEFDDVAPTLQGRIDPAAFAAAYAGRAPRDADDELLAVLSFVKLNAGEAYGVEVTGRARAAMADRPESMYRVERVVLDEERYHTRLLVGAANHFGLQVGGAWTPPVSLRFLIFCLAHAPASAFHPILLGSELCGVFLFNWMLTRVSRMFPDAPEVRESMERRLIEVLIDEVGHLAYNRLRTSDAGVRVAKVLAGGVLASNELTVPEALGLGLDAEARKALDGFDYAHLPEEVRRRSFFV